MVKALDAVMKAIGILLRLLLIFAVGLTCLQIVFRYVINHPLTWTEQLSRFSFIWMMMLGIPVLFHRKDFMAFDLILNAFPPKIHNVIRVLIDIGISLFAIFWFVGAINLCAGTMNKMTSGVRIHYYWLYGAQALSALLILWVMATQAVQNILHAIKGTPAADFNKLPETEEGESE